MICSWASSRFAPCYSLPDTPIVVNQPFNRFLIAVAAATSNLFSIGEGGRKGITLLQKWSNSVTEMTRIKDGAALMTHFYDYHRRLLSSGIHHFLFSFSMEKINCSIDTRGVRAYFFFFYERLINCACKNFNSILIVWIRFYIFPFCII